MMVGLGNYLEHECEALRTMALPLIQLALIEQKSCIRVVDSEGSIIRDIPI